MKAKIAIAMDSAAFANSYYAELARILRELADKIDGQGEYHCILRDINGNSVGTFSVIE